jgi:hypothetical protein
MGYRVSKRRHRGSTSRSVMLGVMDAAPSNSWPEDATDARHYWASQFAAARSFMQSRRNERSVLIEIAAQHPLINGDQPGREFTARLDRGIELFRIFRQLNSRVEIYVPGSRHVHEGTPDTVSLSYAGLTYLQATGIPSVALHGDDLNLTYKGDAGVYNSADECFVASSYFKDGGFGRLVSVVSPAQLMRKTLHYAAFGVLPLTYTAPTEEMFHDYVDELFEKIPYVLLVDHDLQSPDSMVANAMRADRKPR